ncbi:MAG TPA: diaminopimelate decarboxylase [Solirubrobacteraceae bacterium]|nr:diaminopimelate decarboxylase [Solirubrobacteraceae bacterium]
MHAHATTQPAGLLELFPPGTERDRSGRLSIGGCEVRDLAERFGTPLYVIDEDGLREQARRFRDALAARWPNGQVVFASKAFSCVPVLSTLASEGLGVDIAGGGELAVALAAGVNPGDIVMHGNAKTEAELRMALDAGVGTIVVDNHDDIDRLEALVTGRQHVLVRVLPDVAPDTHAAISTGGAGSKFGLPLPEARRAIARLRASRRLVLDGVHVHIGSQILQTEPFAQAVARVAELGEFGVYDLGGGLGVSYTGEEQPPTPEEWIGALADAAERHLPAGARILIEPGRSLVARAGVTVYRVVTVKHGDPTFVAVDGGMGDNLEVALYGQRFVATIDGRPGAGDPVELVGRHCESGDRLISGVPLPDPAPGDLVVVPVTGAYCFTMANNYNGALRPPVVFCRDGEARAVVRRETYADLLARNVATG